jgi:replication factor C subunit 3/5
MESGRLPHLMFYGPPGTGKTSTILALARQLNGSNYQQLILELNASDERRIETVREQIKEFASTKMIVDRGLKLVILDEADAMTNDAQAALRRVMEKYTANTRFCLICNHVGKIIPALQSRCTKFRFAPLQPEHIKERLHEVCKSEKVKLTEDGEKALLRLARGDMRKVLNTLQATSMAFGEVSEETVYSCTGTPLPADIRAMFDALLNFDCDEALKKVTALKIRNGAALADVIRDLHSLIAQSGLDNNTLQGLYMRLSDIEVRLAHGASERLQLAALVSSFQYARVSVAGE